MKIAYYMSRLCPRCVATTRLLSRLKREHPEIEVEQIEVLTNPGRTLSDGIWMVPTLIVGSRRFHHAPRMEELLAALDS